MASWKKALRYFVADTEKEFDKLKYRLSYALGGPGPIKIIPYRGYGTSQRLYLKGRVLEDKNIPEAGENDRLWDNLTSMYKRMESDEIPGAVVKARFRGKEIQAKADVEGFFEIWLDLDTPLLSKDLWHPVELELVSPLSDHQEGPVTAVGQVMVPPPSARYVVISDIDDTVLQTDATHLINMARNVFLGNARTRLPFPGVAGLYRALFSGKTGAEQNPLFYVSSSPWNLYDLLVQFFTLNNIPEGPVLFLRDWGITREELLPLRHGPHKIAVIRQMLDFYPELPFILLGDSGQEDPEIYASIAKEYPERILAVYIRNVSRDLKRPESIRELAEQLVEAGSALVLADDSVGIANHAIEREFISPISMADIRDEKEKDEAPATPLDKVLSEEEKADVPEVEVVSGEENALQKEPPQPRETKKAIREGAIEDAMKNAGKEETSKPPTVVVDTPEAKEKAEKEARPGKATEPSRSKDPKNRPN
jgi:phosphatidate phosphatase APP1